MLHRDPFTCTTDGVTGEELLDLSVDALLTVALADGGELVEAAVGWYDTLLGAFWNGDQPHPLGRDIVQWAALLAEQELPGMTRPTSGAYMQMHAFSELMLSSLRPAAPRDDESDGHGRV